MQCMRIYIFSTEFRTVYLRHITSVVGVLGWWHWQHEKLEDVREACSFSNVVVFGLGTVAWGKKICLRNKTKLLFFSKKKNPRTCLFLTFSFFLDFCEQDAWFWSFSSSGSLHSDLPAIKLKLIMLRIWRNTYIAVIKSLLLLVRALYPNLRSIKNKFA